MNNLPLNERQLADKLRNAPVPDADRSWEQMRKLLDREMPEVAGTWAGYNKWGWMAMTAGIILVAAWLTQFLNRSDRSNLATKTQSESNSAPADKKAGDKKIVVLNDKSTQQPTNNIAPVAGNKQPDATTSAADVIVKKSQSSYANTSSVKTRIKNKNNSLRDNVIQPDQQLVIKKKDEDRSANNQSISNQPSPLVQPVTDDKNNQSQTTSDIIEVKAANVNGSIIEADHSLNAADAFDDEALQQSSVKAISGKTDKKSLRELRKQYMKEDNRRISRSGMRGNFGDDGKDITFAAGLSLPQSFAVGAQQSPSFGINGKSNRLTDYLPAPFFQYYVNSKLFLQTEFHFQSPQYTNRLLLARSTTAPTSNTTLQKNIYLEKLYYFNIPLNLYYSPVRNFSIGTGLQYSSLLSGVASFEEKRSEGQNPVSFQSTTRRFKDDSVAARFAPSEWRYQFDANYYFKRFTVGLRYNKAMRDFVNFRIDNTLLTQDRNRAFLFYLRYNIWEERKKD